MTDTLYKKAICGCEVEVTAAYNWVDGVIEVEEVYIVKACDYHQPKDSLEYVDKDKLLAEASELIASAAELMSSDMLSQWTGAREWLHQAMKAVTK